VISGVGRENKEKKPRLFTAERPLVHINELLRLVTEYLADGTDFTDVVPDMKDMTH